MLPFVSEEEKRGMVSYELNSNFENDLIIAIYPFQISKSRPFSFMSNSQYEYDSNLLFFSNKYSHLIDDSQDIFAVDADIELMFGDEPKGLKSGSFDQSILI
jgi:hypothetical protein